MTPGQMITAVARILSLPEEKLRVVDRSLCKAGVRVPNGRGRSARSVDEKDAAALVAGYVVYILGYAPATAAGAFLIENPEWISRVQEHMAHGASYAAETRFWGSGNLRFRIRSGKLRDVKNAVCARA